MRRVVGGVRALQIAGRSPCPVLSVTSTWTGLPAVVVAPMDFSPASIRATQAAMLIAAEGARVILVHVPLPVHFRHAIRDKAGSVVGGDVDALFSKALEQLKPLASPGMTFETSLEEGSVVSAVLSVAESERADLIAVGTHGPGPVERFFVGSVAAGLLHNATCPVLVSPPPGMAEFIRLELGMTGDATTDDPAAWGDVLADASKRNAGRRLDIEVDDPSIGAQVQAAGYFLRGIDYDPAERCVEVMVDDGPGGTAHLSRSIANVRSIAIAATPAGRDLAIEIAHGRGHTLIHFRD
jgi:nucleotide-binding universal stress UspA family protein